MRALTRRPSLADDATAAWHLPRNSGGVRGAADRARRYRVCGDGRVLARSRERARGQRARASRAARPSRLHGAARSGRPAGGQGRQGRRRAVRAVRADGDEHASGLVCVQRHLVERWRSDHMPEPDGAAGLADLLRRRAEGPIRHALAGPDYEELDQWGHYHPGPYTAVLRMPLTFTSELSGSPQQLTSVRPRWRTPGYLHLDHQHQRRPAAAPERDDSSGR
jgi:hypothetical protein